MKILLLSDPNSAHTFKWVKSLLKKGCEIYLFGVSGYNKELYAGFKNLHIETFGIDDSVIKSGEGNLSKLQYLYSIPRIKKIIRSFKPDIMHAHSASSYGLLGSLCGFSPYIVSVWGLDVFTFPKKSALHEFLIKYILKKADYILSTSNIMAKETSLYTSKDISVTPFGIDMEMFKPEKVKRICPEEDIVIGIIKTLEKNYGIDCLIRSFKILKDRNHNLPLKLMVVGKGSQENELKKLAKELNLNGTVVFTGAVEYKDVPRFQNMLDISVSLSHFEGFGVSTIEACACEKPVVVANVGGLAEIVNNNESGFIVPPCNPVATAEALEKLVLDKGLRDKFGKRGREIVREKYFWDDNVNLMMDIYDKVLAVNKN
jgi:glycosyltransferase involved in cell wall biosynthesis